MNKNMNRRMKSFTMLEMIFAMMISSIVIGIVYYTYLLLHQQFIRYQERSKVASEYLLFQQVMQLDLDKAQAVTAMETDRLQLEMPAGVEPVEYLFTGNSIARTSGEAVDSFRVGNNGYQAIYFNDQLQLIAQLVIPLHITDKPVATYFNKQYSASQLMLKENHEPTDQYP